MKKTFCFLLVFLVNSLASGQGLSGLSTKINTVSGQAQGIATGLVVPVVAVGSIVGFLLVMFGGDRWKQTGWKIIIGIATATIAYMFLKDLVGTQIKELLDGLQGGSLFGK